LYHKRYKKPSGPGREVTVEEFVASASGGEPVEPGDWFVVRNHGPNPRNFYTARIRGHRYFAQLPKSQAYAWAKKVSERVRISKWERKEVLCDVQDRLKAGTISHLEASKLICKYDG